MRTSALLTDKETASGRLVDLLNPEPGDIDLFDIATSLAYQNRFDGHARCHYSVAQHSVFVASLLSDADAVHGLLHDAPEMLIGDLSSPMKCALKQICHDFSRAWKWIEGAAERAIYDSLGVALPSPLQRERVKQADLIALATEARDIMRTPNQWNLAYPPASTVIRPMPADRAQREFLSALARVGVAAAGPAMARTVLASAA